MLQRSSAALTSSERQLLKSQWLSSGQCARCFHASRTQRAGEDHGNGKNVPNNRQNKSRSRHQRSAMISNEVSMLQRGPPPSPPKGAFGDSSGPGSLTGAQTISRASSPATGFAETPRSMPGERMGENVSAGREGPNAQGVGRIVRRDEEVADTSRQARGVRSPGGKTEEPVEGGESVLGATRAGDPTAGENEGLEGEEGVKKDIPLRSSDTQIPQRRVTASVPGIRFTPSKLSTASLLSSGQGASTLAAQNYLGIVTDRLAAQSSTSRVSRTPNGLNQKVSQRQPVLLTPSERANLGKDRGSGLYPRIENVRKLPAGVRESVVARMVAGVYDADQVLEGKEKYKQPVLNNIAKMVLRNGSYLAGDGERVVRKVQGLLPAMSVAQRKPGQQVQKQRK